MKVLTKALMMGEYEKTGLSVSEIKTVRTMMIELFRLIISSLASMVRVHRECDAEQIMFANPAKVAIDELREAPRLNPADYLILPHEVTDVEGNVYTDEEVFNRYLPLEVYQDSKLKTLSVHNEERYERYCAELTAALNRTVSNVAIGGAYIEMERAKVQLSYPEKGHFFTAAQLKKYKEEQVATYMRFYYDKADYREVLTCMLLDVYCPNQAW